jgi:hypothetical protein
MTGEKYTPAFDSRFARRWENKLQGQMIYVCH